MRRTVALGLLGFALFAFGCGGDGATTPTPISYDGTWSGTTSQGLPFSFVVANNAVTRLTWQVRADSGGCGGTTGRPSDISPAASISNGSFSVQVHSVTEQNDVTFTWPGTFASASSASGTPTYTVIWFTCGGTTASGSFTWTATK